MSCSLIELHWSFLCEIQSVEFQSLVTVSHAQKVNRFLLKVSEDAQVVASRTIDLTLEYLLLLPCPVRHSCALL